MIPSPIIWGLLLGLGSSLHCAGMCGPISCSLLMLGGDDRDRKQLALRIGTMQAGRILSYVLLGAVVGLFGAGLQARLEMASVHMALQWVAGAVVLWLGLSTAGFVPSLALADRLTMPLASGLAGVRAALSGGGVELALISGLVWGITPCAMVYAALFNSLVTGNVADGMLLMLAFGLGTLPAVVLSTLTLIGARARRSRPGRQAAGVFMIVAGALALALTVPGSPLCITQ
ncbi:MAG: sulfite exporter TauE/SafE family protein [Candidatus Devosia phytovorans]|uniref:Sulfite exporter TauE/SafE family protein n=1 Tax=Candidatus Devosia phytovorans TaxID=3121372 RepID=A0AAJ5VXF0_9HYPH|nr:sulfite exporter TauE/SafE family protein [Devosia sp.]WEK06671.1 MAG: sulfite exporter TauE/SafE family protein [Devosia sp.]